MYCRSRFFSRLISIPIKEKAGKNISSTSRHKRNWHASGEFEDYYKIIFATKEFAKQLNCIVGTPLLEVTQTVLTPDNSIIYVNKQYILSTKYIYAVRSLK